MSSKQSQFHSASKSTLLNKAVHDISDSDATEEPESLPDSEPDSDVTVDPDTLAYNSGQDLFSDYSNNSFDKADTVVTPCLSTELLKIMSSKKSRQETHAISESDSDSESEQNSRSKYNSKHHVQKLSSSVKVDSRKHQNPCRENGSRSSSHESRQKANKTNHHTLQHSSSSSSKDSSNSSKKSSHRPDSSAVNGSELFSNPVNLCHRSSSLPSQSNNSSTSKKTSHCSPTPTPKKTSHTEKATNQNNTSSSLNSKMHDIFGSDSDEDFVVNNNSSDSENESSSNSDVNGNSPDTNSHSPMTHSSSSHHKMSPSSSHSSSSSSASSSSDSDSDSDSDDDNSGVDTHSPKSKIKSVKSDSSDTSHKPSKTNSSGKSSVTSTTETALDKLVSSSEDSETVKRKRPVTPTKLICRFGTACTRKNPTHWEDFEHHEIEEKKPSVKKQKANNDSPPAAASVSKSPVVSPTTEKKSQSGDKTMSLEKSIRTTYREGQPFSFFLTRVKGISSQYNSSFVMGISDILSSAFGNLQASCQFNYMFDIKFLMQQYAPEFRQKPVLIVHGFKGSEMTGLQNDASKFPNVSLCQARLDIPFGTHHSKMMFLLYDNGMRVVIHTANLIPGDWYQKTQGVWVSPLFPKLRGGANKNDGQSPTAFKRDLIQYVAAYRNPSLARWEKHLLEHDMSSAKVYLIASVPGRHSMLQKNAWGHLKLRKILLENGPDKLEVGSWPVVCQFSSIGSLGPTADKWLCGEFHQSLAACRSSIYSPLTPDKMKLIFPSVENVRISLEGYPAGTCLPYSIQTASKQPYLLKFLHQWKSEGRGRTRACPHIKTYMRPSPDYSLASWFMVTSANLSKAAWGVLEKDGSQVMIRSYEIGVLFLPNVFDMKRLKLTNDVNEGLSSEKPSFVLPYDIPLKPYKKDDEPWVYDIAHKELPDCNGMMWCPSLL
ncbi:tyrosyl-DNA phosphodiesterase 1 isoform X2 [Octopus sinensis]|uniref:Tyrosyl-DNA phosphodiesterase 1 isoform X2 n=1 Tax=Octopus sinensis TaxID=2607531 RepID=A0A7E6EVW8_9MOLL|nr:tyrosyl-DNA phosphodiesterase 1 isoform X2 [Octopus sinensis]